MQLGIREDLHLDLVDDAAEIGVEAGVQDVAEMLEVESLLNGILADANPCDVALADVLDALGAVDEVVNLPFENGLEVSLHLASSDLD